MSRCSAGDVRRPAVDGGDAFRVAAGPPERLRLVGAGVEQGGQLGQPVVAELGDVGPHLTVVPRLVLTRNRIGAAGVIDGEMPTEPGDGGVESVEPVRGCDGVRPGRRAPLGDERGLGGDGVVEGGEESIVLHVAANRDPHADAERARDDAAPLERQSERR